MVEEKQITKPTHSILREILMSSGIAAVSACIAETITIPLDTIKVRLQMQNTNSFQKLATKVTEEVKQDIKNGVTLDKSKSAVEETLKVQEKPTMNLPKYRGLIGTGKTIIAEEGALTLFNGLNAGI